MLAVAVAQGLPGGYYTSRYGGEETDNLLDKISNIGGSNIIVVSSGDYSTAFTQVDNYPSYYYKDGFGVVHLHICAKLTTETGVYAAGIIELRDGYRPRYSITIPAAVTKDGRDPSGVGTLVSTLNIGSSVSVYNSVLHPKGTVYSASVSFYAGR